ncbi:Ubiquinone/menaquinone biosynthesis C-methylase UbiE [Paenibacillus sp. 1_12]|uniref:class I SAM-dependent methyltransferase n=1 Tax=Paenibacillus sp. 1_12 TaxID=1566278 RepID=UPI0008F0EC2A|nr:class I SAM-dependent methyltransferase [Paenibacillus sp. 1_12]SFL24367.1 Ubiquinone/menaquinone biosynthesis C-methylase UbiE [Paenibacillus sp. 1_12]
MSINDWEAFFDTHAPHYMNNSFTKNTVAEIDFVVEQLKIPAGSFILDVGCGTGRHSIELAKRGYQVTGIDISSGMLEEASKAAYEAKVVVEWIHGDAVKYTPTHSFDGVICLCEGAFGLVGKDEDPMEHDMAILNNICKALKPKAQFILTTLNAYSKIRSFTQEEVDRGIFNPVTMIENNVVEWDLPEGKKLVQLKERRYLPTELQEMFHKAGLRVENIWGGTAGKWGQRKINLDEVEIMIVATKE